MRKTPNAVNYREARRDICREEGREGDVGKEGGRDEGRDTGRREGGRETMGGEGK